MGLGAALRSTPGGIAGVFTLLLVLPALAEAMPPSLGNTVNPYLPANAGQALLAIGKQPQMPDPWPGFAVGRVRTSRPAPSSSSDATPDPAPHRRHWAARAVVTKR